MNALADSIVEVLFAGLWQGVLIACATLGLLALAPHASAATRHAVLWCGFLAIAVIPAALALPRIQSVPAVTAVSPIRASTSASVQRVDASASATSPVHPRVIFDLGKGATALVALWALGVLISLGRLLGSLARVAQVRRSARVTAMCDGVPICTSETISVPIAAGLVRPAVIVPAALMEALPKSDIDCIVSHEVAHVRRGDGWSKLLQLAVQSILFFNPALLVLGRRIAIEREIACDDIAAAGADDRERLARCLVDLAERVSLAPASALGMFGGPNATLVRIRRLLDGRYDGRRRVSRPLFGGVLVLIATLTLALHAFSPIVAFASPVTSPTAFLTPVVAPVAPVKLTMTSAQWKTLVKGLKETSDRKVAPVKLVLTTAQKIGLASGLKWAATPKAAPLARVRPLPGVATLASEAPKSTAVAPVAQVAVAVATPDPDCSKDAQVINAVQPVYPETAKYVGGGPYSVTLGMTIDPTGHVIDVRVLQSSGRSDLDYAAKAAALQSTYSPKVVDCKPVTGNYKFRVRFSMGSN